ncbi:hypothetical protein [Haloplanus pelagicus]|nr:hypothetical protein [Haloplanus sp. HW8-1]
MFVFSTAKATDVTRIVLTETANVPERTFSGAAKTVDPPKKL